MHMGDDVFKVEILTIMQLNNNQAHASVVEPRNQHVTGTVCLD